jgi:Domain of unknown function (DUF4397)
MSSSCRATRAAEEGNLQMTSRIALSVLAACLGAPVLCASSAHAQALPSLLIVHGIEGSDLGPAYLPTLPVNVQIDGVCVTQQPVQFGTVLGPYPLAAGAHSVKFSLANTSAPCSNIAFLTAPAGLSAGQQFALVAWQGTDGSATTRLFDLTEETPVAAGTARAVVFNTSDGPAVDVGLSNSEGASTTFSDVAPGTRSAGNIPPFTTLGIRVMPTGTTNVMAGPLGFTAADRSIEALFVVGNATDGTVTVIPKEIHGVF